MHRVQADPWKDLDVIDSRAVRTGQATTAVMSLIGIAGGWPIFWALMSVQLALGLTRGRRWCLPCLIYFGLIQPRAGEGPLEDSRPPRLANLIGCVCLGAAAFLWAFVSEDAAIALAALVAALATLAASTGLCMGCELYKLVARLRGIRPRDNRHFDLRELGLEGAEHSWVSFSHPLCWECQQWDKELSAKSEPVRIVDVREEPELAEHYGIAVVPTVYELGPDGVVIAQPAP